MPNLILLRHGQSEWNKAGLFTGMVDVGMTDEGKAEALQAGDLLKEANLLPTIVHTSLLSRAIQTAELALQNCGRSWIPVERSWRLNERHYGALQGLNKVETVEKFGAEQVKFWRRGYATAPPPIEIGSQWDVSSDPRYAGLPEEARPRCESLSTVVDRAVPYFTNEITSNLSKGHTVLVAAHGNSLRALVKHLEHISDEEIVDLELPTGVPRVYTFNQELDVEKVVELGDPEAIAAAKVATAKQTAK